MPQVDWCHFGWMSYEELKGTLKNMVNSSKAAGCRGTCDDKMESAKTVGPKRQKTVNSNY